MSKKIYSYEDCKTQLNAMATKIVEMEKSFDDSMRGVFLDQMITNYVGIMGKEFCMMYEFVVANQKDKYQSYGDIDTSVNKITITNVKPDDSNHMYTASGIFLRDIFCGQNYIIVKHISTHKTIESFVETHYHVRLTKKETMKSMSYKDIAYGDVRDDGYVVSFKETWFDEGIKVVDYRGMGPFLGRFDRAFFAMRQPYFELNENLKQKDLADNEE